MNTCQTRCRNARLVTLDDQGYVAFKRRLALERAERKRQDAERLCREASFGANTGLMDACPEFLPIEAYVEGSLARVFTPDTQAQPNEAAFVCEDRRLSGEAQHTARRQDSKRPAEPNIGLLVERAARHWLGFQVKLENRRILAWREQRGEQSQTRYAELDAVYAPDYDALSLFEIKFTTEQRMRGQAGQWQLDRAALVLATLPRYRRILKRLVYIGCAEDRTLSGVTSVRADEDSATYGVVWIAPQEIEAAASDLGMTLPSDWRNPALRRAPSRADHGPEGRTQERVFQSEADRGYFPAPSACAAMPELKRAA